MDGEACGCGTALIFARTETVCWQERVFKNAKGILFIAGRLCFYKINGEPGDPSPAPSALVAYGKKDADILELALPYISGHFIRL